MTKNVSSIGYTDDQIQKTQNYFLLLFFLSSQTVSIKLFQKKPKITISSLLKNPKNSQEKKNHLFYYFAYPMEETGKRHIWLGFFYLETIAITYNSIKRTVR